MGNQFEQATSETDAGSGAPLSQYEPPTLTPLGTADEAMADVISFS